jgi:PAS domain S-box-containing protein
MPRPLPAGAPPGVMEPTPGVTAGPSEILRAVVDVSIDAVVVCDAGGRIAVWGDVPARLFGYPAAAVLGRPLTALFPDHVAADVNRLMARALSGERIVGVECESMRGDGLPVPVTLSLCPAGGVDQPAGALVAVVRDVTEQRVAQATLAELEVRLRQGEVLTHVGSWLWDVRTDVVQWSEEFHRLHGVDPLEFGGTLAAYLDAVAAGDRAGLERAMRAAVEAGRAFEAEYEVPGRGRVYVRAEPAFGSAGSVVGLRGVGRPVQS